MGDSAVSFDWAINIYMCVCLTDWVLRTHNATSIWQQDTLKANSHIQTQTNTPCRAAPGPCRVAEVSYLIYTMRPFWIHTCHAMPMPCSDHAALKATFQGYGIAWHGLCELTWAVERRPVGNLPSFGFFRLLS